MGELEFFNPFFGSYKNFYNVHFTLISLEGSDSFGVLSRFALYTGLPTTDETVKTTKNSKNMTN